MPPRRVSKRSGRIALIDADPQEGYKTLVEGTPVSIHPSSALFQRPPEWCIYYELVLTASESEEATKERTLLTHPPEEYMHQVTAIEPKWLSEVAPTFFRVADQNKISKRKAAEKIEPLFDRFAADKDDWVSIEAGPVRPRLTPGSVSASKSGQHDHLKPSERNMSLYYIAYASPSRIPGRMYSTMECVNKLTVVLTTGPARTRHHSEILHRASLSGTRLDESSCCEWSKIIL